MLSLLIGHWFITILFIRISKWDNGGSPKDFSHTAAAYINNHVMIRKGVKLSVYYIPSVVLYFPFRISLEFYNTPME